MIDARERTHYYHSQNLTVEHGFDAPDTEYPWERHPRAILYTIAGSVLLTREGIEPTMLLPGMEAIVESDQPHHGVVGGDGWKYLVAYNAAEFAEHEARIVNAD